MNNNQAQLLLIQSFLRETSITKKHLRHLRNFLIENPDEFIVIKDGVRTTLGENDGKDY